MKGNEPMEQTIAAALEAARAAADVVRHYYQSNLAITIKADKSPVTEADQRAGEQRVEQVRGQGHGATPDRPVRVSRKRPAVSYLLRLRSHMNPAANTAQTTPSVTCPAKESYGLT